MKFYIDYIWYGENDYRREFCVQIKENHYMLFNYRIDKSVFDKHTSQKEIRLTRREENLIVALNTFCEQQECEGCRFENHAVCPVAELCKQLLL